MFASDRDRERAAETLRAGYVDGRLTFDELSERADAVLGARSRAELRRALSGLPWLRDDLADRGRSVVHAAPRWVWLLVLVAAWVAFTIAVFLVLTMALLFKVLWGPRPRRALVRR